MFLCVILAPYIGFTVLGLIALKVYLKYNIVLCGCPNRLDGKVVIVTGANTGIGYETAKDLARRGAKIILACRDKTRGEEATVKIIQSTGNSNVFFRKLDLSSFKSIREFVDGILKEEKSLNILVNNAGVSNLGNYKSEDGIQIGMQVNHFGPFLLTNLLLPLLEKSSGRIVNVSSMMHAYGKVDFDDIDGSKNWHDFHIYSDSKLYNILMVNELNRRYKGRITANSIHPGLVYTGILRSVPFFIRVPFLFVLKYFYKTAEEGAQTTIHCAVSHEAGVTGGQYYVDCNVAISSCLSKSPEVAAKLWDVSIKLVGLSK